MGGPGGRLSVHWRQTFMDPQRKTSVVMALLIGAFAVLALVFAWVPARPGVVKLPPIVPPDALSIVPGTVRISAGQLIRSGGDVSGMACYA